MDAQNFVLSSPLILCLLTFLPIVIIILKIKIRRTQNLPPSPPKLPIIGNLHQISSLPHKSFRNLSEKYGPIMLLHLGRVPTLVVSSLEIVKELFKVVEFEDRPSVTGLGIVFKGSLDMAFGPYSDHSREGKKLCILQLLSQKRVQQHQFIREEEVQNTIDKIRVLSGSGCAFNISDLFMSLAHNILCRSAFGRLYENGHENDHQHKSFGEVVRRTMDLLSAFCFNDMFPFLGWIDHLTGLIRELKRTSKELHDFLDRVIENRLALMDDDEKLEEKKYLVDILLHLQKEGMELYLSNDNIKAILMDMLIAGIDTSAATIEWMMAELMKNPSIRNKAQEEVRRVVGKKSEITQADINEMKYLKCIMKETVRFHASTVVPRQTSSSVKLQGYEIPSKTRVFINLWAIQRDPEFWERPEEFIPERFVNSSDNIDRLLYSFGGGKRHCPGMSYAYAEVEYTLANLLFWFDWELGEKDFDMDEVYTFIISKKNPLHVKARPYLP
ncbi:cytochrome P450 family 71 subfamily B polypeptide 10 [Euphorbia peplus]|nr:cytochrome P450 family 71 subfamily B polypeptide 10 [Euphorbia peplus]